MSEVSLIYIPIFFLIILQSIAGVGILLVGTPLLLILKLDIISILSILLPISILTSLVNLIIFKLNKEKFKLIIDKETKKKFFSICIPSILIGLFFLKQFKELINFNYLVSFIIFSSIIMINSKRYLNKINDKIRIFFLFLVGTVHGLTNSGGSLLSLFLLNLKNKNQSRYNTTYFYFFLAFLQFIMFLIIFKQKFYLENIELLLFLILLGAFIGNNLTIYIKEKAYKFLINFLCIITCTVLIVIK